MKAKPLSMEELKKLWEDNTINLDFAKRLQATVEENERLGKRNVEIVKALLEIQGVLSRTLGHGY